MAGPLHGSVLSDPSLLFWGVLGGFLLGSVPFSFLLGRTRGIDLRQLGSGNVGATNLGRNAGLLWGVGAFLLDAAKGAIPPLLIREFGGVEGATILAGGAAVLGHCYSPWLKFSGGKGVATMSGLVVVAAAPLAAVLFFVWGGVLSLSRNVGLASVCAAAAAFGLGNWVVFSSDTFPQGIATSSPWLGGLLITLSSLVVYRHRSNLRELLVREES